MQRKQTTLSILAGGAFATMLLAATVNDAGRGREAFGKRCSGCHALDKTKLGPPLRGVYGRSAGKNAQFSYSEAMKNSSVVWDESTLDRWLTDTDSVIPSNDMAFRLDNAVDRSNIIAYLKQLSSNP